MAKLPAVNFLKELKDSITYSTNLPWAVLGRAVLINTLCPQTDDLEQKNKQQEYLLNSHKIQGHNKWARPTFSTIIGLRALNILALPYLVVNGLRQVMQKSIDKLSFIGSPGLSAGKSTPWYARIAKAVIALALVPIEVPCYCLSKIADKMAGLFGRKQSKSPEIELGDNKYRIPKPSSPKVASSTKNIEKTLTGSAVKLEISNSASVSDSPRVSPKATSEDPAISSSAENTVRIHRLIKNNQVVRIHLPAKAPSLFSPTVSPRVKRVRYRVVSEHQDLRVAGAAA